MNNRFSTRSCGLFAHSVARYSLGCGRRQPSQNVSCQVDAASAVRTVLANCRRSSNDENISSSPKGPSWVAAVVAILALAAPGRHRMCPLTQPGTSPSLSDSNWVIDVAADTLTRPHNVYATAVNAAVALSRVAVRIPQVQKTSHACRLQTPSTDSSYTLEDTVDITVVVEPSVVSLLPAILRLLPADVAAFAPGVYEAAWDAVDVSSSLDDDTAAAIKCGILAAAVEVHVSAASPYVGWRSCGRVLSHIAHIVSRPYPSAAASSAEDPNRARSTLDDMGNVVDAGVALLRALVLASVGTTSPALRAGVPVPSLFMPQMPLRLPIQAHLPADGVPLLDAACEWLARSSVVEMPCPSSSPDAPRHPVPVVWQPMAWPPSASTRLHLKDVLAISSMLFNRRISRTAAVDIALVIGGAFDLRCRDAVDAAPPSLGALDSLTQIASTLDRINVASAPFSRFFGSVARVVPTLVVREGIGTRKHFSSVARVVRSALRTALGSRDGVATAPEAVGSLCAVAQVLICAGMGHGSPVTLGGLLPSRPEAARLLPAPLPTPHAWLPRPMHLSIACLKRTLERLCISSRCVPPPPPPARCPLKGTSNEGCCERSYKVGALPRRTLADDIAMAACGLHPDVALVPSFAVVVWAVQGRDVRILSDGSVVAPISTASMTNAPGHEDEASDGVVGERGVLPRGMPLCSLPLVRSPRAAAAQALLLGGMLSPAAIRDVVGAGRSVATWSASSSDDSAVLPPPPPRSDRSRVARVPPLRPVVGRSVRQGMNTSATLIRGDKPHRSSAEPVGLSHTSIHSLAAYKALRGGADALAVTAAVGERLAQYALLPLKNTSRGRAVPLVEGMGMVSMAANLVHTAFVAAVMARVLDAASVFESADLLNGRAPCRPHDATGRWEAAPPVHQCDSLVLPLPMLRPLWMAEGASPLSSPGTPTAGQTPHMSPTLWGAAGSWVPSDTWSEGNGSPAASRLRSSASDISLTVGERCVMAIASPPFDTAAARVVVEGLTGRSVLSCHTISSLPPRAAAACARLRDDMHFPGLRSPALCVLELDTSAAVETLVFARSGAVVRPRHRRAHSAVSPELDVVAVGDAALHVSLPGRTLDTLYFRRMPACDDFAGSGLCETPGCLLRHTGVAVARGCVDGDTLSLAVLKSLPSSPEPSPPPGPSPSASSRTPSCGVRPTMTHPRFPPLPPADSILPTSGSLLTLQSSVAAAAAPQTRPDGSGAGSLHPHAPFWLRVIMHAVALLLPRIAAAIPQFFKVGDPAAIPLAAVSKDSLVDTDTYVQNLMSSCGGEPTPGSAMRLLHDAGDVATILAATRRTLRWPAVHVPWRRPRGLRPGGVPWPFEDLSRNSKPSGEPAAADWSSCQDADLIPPGDVVIFSLSRATASAAVLASAVDDDDYIALAADDFVSQCPEHEDSAPLHDHAPSGRLGCHTNSRTGVSLRVLRPAAAAHPVLFTNVPRDAALAGLVRREIAISELPTSSFSAGVQVLIAAARAAVMCESASSPSSLFALAHNAAMAAVADPHLWSAFARTGADVIRAASEHAIADMLAALATVSGMVADESWPAHPSGDVSQRRPLGATGADWLPALALFGADGLTIRLLGEITARGALLSPRVAVRVAAALSVLASCLQSSAPSSAARGSSHSRNEHDDLLYAVEEGADSQAELEGLYSTQTTGSSLADSTGDDMGTSPGSTTEVDLLSRSGFPTADSWSALPQSEAFLAACALVSHALTDEYPSSFSPSDLLLLARVDPSIISFPVPLRTRVAGAVASYRQLPSIGLGLPPSVGNKLYTSRDTVALLTVEGHCPAACTPSFHAAVLRAASLCGLSPAPLPLDIFPHRFISVTYQDTRFALVAADVGSFHERSDVAVGEIAADLRILRQHDIRVLRMGYAPPGRSLVTALTRQLQAQLRDH
eukprot:TRINITY_DN1423_c0_g5_i1.p1 TRINITY_DN1423_c0_g5~~TRINITY_DN1423_c0_g5_i1.p1  ORF type:complete len:1920 (+),score=105.11 TRINITY_DN1423_c0_g5_i1:157-5916(+)